MSDNWINIIPSDWTLLRLGSIFNLRNQKVSDKDYLPLSVSRGGVVPQMENVAKSDASDDRKLVLKGDFAINSRSDRKQSCGVAPMDGSVSLINLILYCKDNESIYTPYLNYLLKNYGFAEEFYKWGHGIVADLWTTRWQEMKSILLPIPSINEQKEIAIILDAKISQLDSLISNQEKQIAKLEEYKQAIITKAVTKGLNPNVKMKESGVEWIGEIPEEWNVIKFKYLYNKSNTGESIDKTHWTNSEVDPVFYTAGLNKIHTSFKCFPREKYTREQDLLMSRNGTPYVFIPDVNAMYTDHVIRVDLKEKICKQFVAYSLQQSIKNVIIDSVSLATWSISLWKEQLLAWPDEKTQNQIVNYLKEKTNEIDILIKIKKVKIDKLEIYKKSLIYECVTGKKRVEL